uniref:Uncharacterized protein n=1 Tax=Ditylenchus dipsaci TaxID=166011 RepID=A0A915EPH5_9BILA
MQQNFVPNPNPFNPMMYQQDVLVVGEPSMMGLRPNTQGGMPPNHHNPLTSSSSTTSMAQQQPPPPQQLHCPSSGGGMMPGQLLGNPLQAGMPMPGDASQMFMTEFGDMQQSSTSLSSAWPPGSMAGTTNS